MTLAAATIELLETAINQALKLDPSVKKRFAKLHGFVICLDLLGTGLKLFMIPGPGDIQLLGTFEGEPDCTLRGTPFALMRMQDEKQRSDQLFTGAVEIQGDTELGHQVGKILGDLNIDWEEQLSHITGDVMAHEVGNIFRNISDWGQKTLTTFGQNFQEYLQEESNTLPNPFEVNAFLADVDTLRHDVERLDSRIKRLTKFLGSQHD